MTQPDQKKDVKLSPIVMFFSLGFWVVLFVGIIFGLVRCVSGDPSISRTQQEKYDACVAIQQKSVGLIKADAACHYLKKR
jgi:hypothetical protein